MNLHICSDGDATLGESERRKLFFFVNNFVCKCDLSVKCECSLSVEINISREAVMRGGGLGGGDDLQCEFYLWWNSCLAVMTNW